MAERATAVSDPPPETWAQDVGPVPGNLADTSYAMLIFFVMLIRVKIKA